MYVYRMTVQVSPDVPPKSFYYSGKERPQRWHLAARALALRDRCRSSGWDVAPGLTRGPACPVSFGKEPARSRRECGMTLRWLFAPVSSNEGQIAYRARA